jgi:hypothetical protein
MIQVQAKWVDTLSEYTNERKQLWGDCRGLRVLPFLHALHPLDPPNQTPTQYRKK